MATTEETERIRALLQGQATQKINPFMRGLSLLTGGLAGEFTGTNEDIRSRALAKQALMEQNIRSLDEDRAIQRQKMENTLRFKTTAAGEGLGMLPGSTEEEVLANYMEARKRKNIGIEAAQMASLGRTPQGMALLANRQDPAFQSGYSAANLDILGKESEAAVQEKIQRPKIVSQLAGYGINADPNIPTGQLGSMLQQAVARSQSQIPAEERGKQARAGLSFLQQKGEIPMVEDLSKIPDEEAVVRFSMLGEEYRQKNRELQFERKRKFEQESLKGFMQELKAEKPDKEKLQSLYSLLPQSSQDNEEFRVSAGVTRPMAKDERDALNSYVSGLGAAGSLAQSIAFFQGKGDLAKVSQKGFNGFKAWMTEIKNKYGVEDPRYAALNDVMQEFEAYVGDKRKTLFGASLTGNELLSAKRMFGDPESANFLPRALKFIDSAFKDDLIERRFIRNAIFVDKATQREVQDARQNWFDTRDQFGFLTLGKKGKVGQVVPAGGTNVMDTIIDMDAQGREIK